MKRYIKASSDLSHFDSEELCVSIVMCHMGGSWEDCEELLDSEIGWKPANVLQYMRRNNYTAFPRELCYLPIGVDVADNYTPQEAIDILPELLGMTTSDAKASVDECLDEDGNWDDSLF